MRNLSITVSGFVPLFFLLFASLHAVKAQVTPVDPQTAAQLQTKLDQLHTASNLKGLSASVIIPGKGVWKGVSGISHAGVPLDTAMVFGFASVTKTFTAAGIMLLHQDGLLSINDSLHEYLPAYPNIDSSITIRQLLNHTSGIFNYFDNTSWYSTVNNNPSQAMTPQFVLNNYVNTPYFAPGAGHQYSNTNYLILGMIIEQVSGQSFAQFTRQRLLNPLQSGSIYVREHEPATGVLPHNWWGAPGGPANDIYTMPMTACFGTSASEAGMAGNARDLARWGQLLFTGAVLHDSLLMMMKQFVPLNGTLFSGYGLGLMRISSGNTQAWGHNGNFRGFSSAVFFSPADSIVVSVLSNQSADLTNIAWSLLSTSRQALDVATIEEKDSRDALVCYPNPVQGTGHIQYAIGKRQHVEITLHNSLGQTVRTLLSQPQNGGRHRLTVDTKALAPGVYFCTLRTAGGRVVQRWVVAQYSTPL